MINYTFLLNTIIHSVHQECSILSTLFSNITTIPIGHLEHVFALVPLSFGRYRPRGQPMHDFTESSEIHNETHWIQ